MRRESHTRSRGPAVLRFFISLLIVIIIVLIAVFLLSRGKNLGGRPYVITGTGEPVTPPPATAAPTQEPTPAPATEAPTLAPTPTPSPTPVPTPTPTVIPETAFSRIRADAKLPDVSTDGEIGISTSYVSALNEYRVMELTGWGYANLEHFDGETCGTYLVVTQKDTGKFAAYFVENEEGISGVDHGDAVCANPSASDWRAYIDVSGYKPGIYTLGLALVYKNGEKDEYRYYRFGELQSFTVNDGEIITPVTVTNLNRP